VAVNYQTALLPVLKAISLRPRQFALFDVTQLIAAIEVYSYLYGTQYCVTDQLARLQTMSLDRQHFYYL
jgi:hypothetical protein